MTKSRKPGDHIFIQGLEGLLGAATTDELQVVTLIDYVGSFLDTGAFGSLEMFELSNRKTQATVAVAVIRLPVASVDLAELVTHLCQALGRHGMLMHIGEANPLPFQDE